MRTIALLAAFTIAAFAADVSGNWTGETTANVNGRIEKDTIYLSLKQTANIITGTAGPTVEQQSRIRQGKIEGNHVVLEVPVPDGVFKFDINLESDRLKGEHLKGDVIVNAQGQTVKAQMSAFRVK